MKSMGKSMGIPLVFCVVEVGGKCADEVLRVRSCFHCKLENALSKIKNIKAIAAQLIYTAVTHADRHYSFYYDV